MTAKTIEQAKLIISNSKTLRAFQIGDTNIALHFFATHVAGRAGLLASAIRSHPSIDIQKFSAMAASEGFAAHDLKTIIYPWFEKHVLCEVERDGSGVKTLRSQILSYSQLLKAVFALWIELEPTPVDQACLLASMECTALPTGRAELSQILASAFDAQTAVLAIDLIKGYKLLSERTVGLPEPLYFSAGIWKHAIGSAGAALSTLKVTDKAVLLYILDQVKQHQGIPESAMRAYAKSQNAVPVLEMAIRLGLLDRTRIRNHANQERAFLISPHFYADVAADHGEDFCDRVKIFLDSIRNGQHFGSSWTGKIDNPDRLLEVLLNRGFVGPVQAIGTGYILPEKAGIVRVEQDSHNTEKFYLHLVQSDTVAVVRQIIANGTPDPVKADLSASVLQSGASFSAAETIRAALGEVPTDVAEAEAEIMRMIRESGCRTV